MTAETPPDAPATSSTGTPRPTALSSRRVELLAVSVPLLLGMLVRIAPVAGAGFPVGDGGMFYVMVREIQQAGMAIPATTAYNGAGIPFAYPPLGLWLVALLGNILPVSLPDLFQWWPVFCSILMLPVFYLLARRLLGSWFAAVVALGAFALLPRSFEWFIVGGGVTRAPGYLFALLAMYAMLLALDTHRRRFVAGAALAAGLAIMTHPNAALLTVLSLVALATLQRLSRRSLATLAVVLAGAALVSAPWWLVDLLRFGAAPLLSAAGTGSQAGPLAGVYRLLTFDFAEEPFMPWITGLAVLGLAWSLARRRFFLPAWLVAIILLDATAAPTDSTIPLALLATVGLLEVVAPRLAGAAGAAADLTGPESLPSRPVRLTLVALLGLTFLGAIFRPIESGSPDQVLAPDVRASMAWVAADTPAKATFLVVTGRDWFSDEVSEWFPALTDRGSVATVQGYEWLGSDRWWRQQDANADLRTCSTAADACLTAWMQKYGVTPTYVYLPKGRIGGPFSAEDCCVGLRQTLRASPDYTVAYDGPGASIFERRTP
jgi:hypothetical protein